jgi:hypothetical protein
MASIWRDPVVLVFVDEDNHELARISRPDLVPRVGENVRLNGNPHLVDRVGYDYPADALERIWVVCRPA